MKVVVATYPDHNHRGSIAEDARLAKIGLFYGDEVELISPVAMMVDALRRTDDLSDEVLGSVLPDVLPYLAIPEAEKLEANRGYQSLKAIRSKNATQFKNTLRKLIRPFRDKVEELVSDTGHSELVPAVKSGLLKTRRSAFSPNDHLVSCMSAQAGHRDKVTNGLIPHWFTALMDAVKSDTVIPILDDRIHGIVQLALKESGESLQFGAESTNKEGDYTRLLFNLIDSLDRASMADVLDIRRTLNQHLKRFRAAVMKFSAEMKSFPHDSPGFAAEFVRSYRLNVEPTLEAIDGAILEESYLREFVRKVADKPIPTILTFCAMALGAKVGLPQGLSALAGLVGIGPTAITVHDDRMKRQKEKAQGLYFYHQASKRLNAIGT